ncbi:hypothetical protein ILYODFUR_032062, partial [Ilyodon furcidens]
MDFEGLSEHQDSVVCLSDESTNSWTQLTCSTPKKNPEPGKRSHHQRHLDDHPVPSGQISASLAGSSISHPNSSLITINEVFRAVTICTSKMEHIISRLNKIEQGLEKIHNKQKKKHKPKKGEHGDKKRHGEYLYEAVLNDFEKYQIGPHISKKDVKNVHQARSHAESFVMFMLRGLPSRAGRRDLIFLDQVERLQQFPWYLAKKGYAPSTIAFALDTVTQFLEHIMTGFQMSSKITQKQLSKLCSEMKRVQAEMTINMGVHSQKVLPKKTEIDDNAAKNNTFLTAARKNIPTLLQRLDKTPNVIRDHNRLMGYFLGYLAIVSGHRSVVFTSMTKGDVVVAGNTKSKRRFHIMVGDDKPLDGSAKASVVLTEEEYGWLEKLINISCCDETSQCQFLFHTVLGTKIYKPQNILQEAWIDCGLKGAVTFSQIRSPVQTQANRSCSTKEKKRAPKELTSNELEHLLEDEASTPNITSTDDEEEPHLYDDTEEDSISVFSPEEGTRKEQPFALDNLTKSCVVLLTRLSQDIVDKCGRGQKAISLSKMFFCGPESSKILESKDETEQEQAPGSTSSVQ